MTTDLLLDGLDHCPEGPAWDEVREVVVVDAYRQVAPRALIARLVP